MTAAMQRPHPRERLARAGLAPRGLSLEEASAYVGLSPNTFLAEVEEGTFPPCVSLTCQRRLWDKAALDKAFDRLSGLRAQREASDPILDSIRARR